MQKHRDITLGRLDGFASDAQLRGRLYRDRVPVQLSVYSAPGRVSYAEAMHGDYRPAQVGEIFGPLWSTHWFRVEIAIPTAWQGQEVHLLWDSTSEACVWQDGQPLQGLTGRRAMGEPIRPEFRLTHSARGGESMALHVEMACNQLFGTADVTDPNVLGRLRQAEIAVFDRDAWDLLWDFVVVADMARHLPPTSPRAGQALRAANDMVNVCDLEDPATWPEARRMARALFAEANGAGQHNASAIGHAHIDTAWLWPLAESVRKCVRTFAAAVRYMQDYPDYKFACSQAQQYEWMKERFPDLYGRIKACVQAGQFVPVGGTWVEMDTNVPSGESLVRQFLLGQRFFRREFGITCRELWIPDVFGYSVQLPQIMAGAGVRYFLTQKLSWNQFNRLPSHTFWWEGLDGTRVLTHFPPADTYNGTATVEQVLKNVSNYKDHERGKESCYVFGFGDGGGGPTREMLERLGRMTDVDGLPRVEMRSPRDFFERCEADAKDLTTWVGELYFELHRGTYTTQAAAKRGNRKAELMLRDAEFLCAAAHARRKAVYPADELTRLWKLVLLNQFHDIIPGSSITEVYEEAAEQYRDVLETAASLRNDAITALQPPAEAGGQRILAVNTLGVPRREVVELPRGTAAVQKGAQGAPLGVVRAPSMGWAVSEADDDVETPVTVAHEGEGDDLVLTNAHLRAVFGPDGRLRSLVHRALGREAIESGAAANHLALFDDHPNNYDAWDVDVFHTEKRWEVGPATDARVIESGPLRVAVEFAYELGSASHMKQTVRLDALSPRLEFWCEVDWHEAHKFLKVEFPLSVRSMQATYEAQFGHVQRPTHFNTSWDLARFEVCAQRWADLSEAGFGVALLNDGKYGHATHGNVMRLSLLRSPKSPDPEADMGRHAFAYALLPHTGSPLEAGVIEQAYAFNVPLLVRATGAEAGEEDPIFHVTPSSVVIDTVKKAEDSDAVVVRLYEAHGGRGRARLLTSLRVKSASLCNLLEEEDEPLACDGHSVGFGVSPFRIVPVKLELAG